MKKKNIIKKLLSVVLSAATVFSLLTLPAHAIIPGEDAYRGQGQGYVYVDYENNKTEYIPQSAVPAFTGTSSYEALNDRDRLRMQQMNAQIMENMANSTQPMDVDTGSFNIISPYAHYTGVVLIAVFREGVYCGHGTGFMVDSDTFVTALHVVAEKSAAGTLILPLDYEDEIRVYFNISEDLGTRIDSEFFESTTLDYYSVYAGMYAGGNLANAGGTMNDWYVGNLNDCVTDDIYFFDCYHSLSSIIGTTTYIVGYPGGYLFQMVETYGIGTAINEDKENFATSNRTEVGISGGPVYTLTNGLRCAGIHLKGYDAGGIYSSFEITFHWELMDAIAWYIN